MKIKRKTIIKKRPKTTKPKRTKKKTTKKRRKTTKPGTRKIKRFCDKNYITVKLPTDQYMKKNGKHRFAYVALLFPDPKSKKDKYMDGCIGVALGLRKQKVKADIICMCTPDILDITKNTLKIVFDKVITVPYIIPHENLINVIRESYKYVFTKFWILNKDIFPYDKVCFVDSDIIPIKCYDTLFTLKTPAGIIEPPRDKLGDNPDKSFKKYRCNSDFKHGKAVKKKYTDLWNKEAGDSNAGLWVLTPNTKEFNDIIKEIRSNPKLWIGSDYYHKGYFDKGDIIHKYTWPEQQYLTVRYSGKWTNIGYEYASWCFQHNTSLGIHYVLRQTPWLHFQDDECVNKYYDVLLWGVKKYPKLKGRLLNDMNW